MDEVDRRNLEFLMAKMARAGIIPLKTGEDGHAALLLDLLTVAERRV